MKREWIQCTVFNILLCENQNCRRLQPDRKKIEGFENIIF